MCGIAGIVRWHGLADGDAASADLMASGMVHRGPDDGGSWKDARAVLVHRRLSILDLSAQGRQPMSSPDGRWILALNGEIYNYRDLAREFPEGFSTRTDTEVLLRLLVRDGETCLTRLRGMFAFALWDVREGRLMLGRDPLGKKPMLYARLPDGLAFASEAGRLKEVSGWDRATDPLALDDYLQYGWIPEPRSLWKGVRKIPAGTAMAFSAAGEASRRYWLPHYGSGLHGLGVDARFDRLEAAVRTAVRRRTVSDVPVGSILSGGIDSSLVTALLREEIPGILHTFSVEYTDRTGSPCPDGEAAKAVAERLGTVHHAVRAGPEVLSRIRPLVRAVGEPMSAPAFVLDHALQEEVKRHVTVVLGGDGADELFGGYASYNLMRLVEHLRPFLSLGRLARRADLRRALPCYGLPAAEIRPALYRAHARFHRADLGVRLGGADPEPGQDLAALHRDSGARTYLEGLFVSDLLYTNRSCITAISDAAGMGHGVEVRAPFLDVDVADLAFQLPLEDRVPSAFDPGRNKPLLRRMLTGRVPDAVMDRQKAGFGAGLPLSDWLRHPDWRPEGERRFASTEGRLGEILDARRIESLWRGHLAGADHGYLLWSLHALGTWMEESA